MGAEALLAVFPSAKVTSPLPNHVRVEVLFITLDTNNLGEVVFTESPDVSLIEILLIANQRVYRIASFRSIKNIFARVLRYGAPFESFVTKYNTHILPF